MVQNISYTFFLNAKIYFSHLSLSIKEIIKDAVEREANMDLEEKICK